MQKRRYLHQYRQTFYLRDTSNEALSKECYKTDLYVRNILSGYNIISVCMKRLFFLKKSNC